MSVTYLTVLHRMGQAFSCEVDVPFTQPLHCHEEYELFYVSSGQGEEFVGDTVRKYTAGDMTLIGSGIPHLHSPGCYSESVSLQNSCWLLRFPRSLFPERMQEIEEYAVIQSLLSDSRCEIRFHSQKTIFRVQKMIQRLNGRNGIDRIIGLYEILNLLGRQGDRELLSPEKFTESVPVSWRNPVDWVSVYLTRNFKDPVTLEMIARQVGLHPASLCRYFKKRTGQTVFEFLNGCRVRYACLMLVRSDLTISQVAFESGFNNLSYFNRVFRKSVGQTPSEYRAAFGK